MTPIERVRRYWFAVLLTVLAGFASWSALVPDEPLPIPPTPPARIAHNPEASRPDTLRDPFMPGAEWRAKLREQSRPTPTPSVGPPASVVAAPPEPPPGSELGYSGTLIVGSTRKAVFLTGEFPEGSTVGRYTIEKVEDDGVVLRYQGKTVTLKVPASSDISTITTGP